MKKNIALLFVMIISLFSLLSINSGEVSADSCDVPLPTAELPEPCDD